MSAYSTSPRRDLSDDENVDRRSTHSSDGRNDDDPEEANRGRRTPENSEDEEDRKKKEEAKKKVKKPKGPVRRQMINEDMLTGPKGLSNLSESLKDFEFGDKGSEKEDLDRLLNKMEQWVHTLHPKHPFDQCLERIEFLGIKKKVVKTYVKKMRMGLLPTMSSETVDDLDPMFNDDDLFLPFENEENNSERGPSESEFPNQEEEEELARQHIASPPDDGFPTLEEQMELEEELMSAGDI